MTQSDAGQTLEWSLSKIIRIEQGASSISVTDLRALLAVYGLTDPERAAELEEAARYSRNQSWWAPFNDVVSPGFNRYLGYESAAISIHGYHSSRLPEHVQTEDYAEALLDEGLNLNVDQRRIELHAARQKRVLGENGPRVAMVLDEAALRRQVGGPAVMVDQLKFLKELATREKADLRALPFMSGVYSSLDDSFVLLGFKDDDDALCLTDPEGTFAVRDGHKPLARYQTCFANLHSKTLSRTDTLTLIDDLTETFRVLLERQ